MAPSQDLLARVERLRALFLDETRGDRTLGDYWRDDGDLAAYDAVLGARIGWKWDAVLAECRDRGLPRADGLRVLDHGCGSGIAARRFVRAFGAGSVSCHDRSPRAAAFAARALQAEFAGVPAHAVDRVDGLQPDVLLVSHVLGELDADAEASLRALIARSRCAILVEPGSRAVSRRLSALRDALVGEFHVVAPCPHRAACPALADAADWCHFFAPPGPEAFTNGDFVRTARALGIDARALPYSFVVLSREPVAVAPPAHRVLGRPRLDKHAATVQLCTAARLADTVVEKRTAPALWRTLKKAPAGVRSLPAP
ncbi:MAG: hypothetical protein JNL08_07370 [Planctomycetes bacterium]|nr:hypothetical protein [Planctomycetota bacterium]